MVHCEYSKNKRNYNYKPLPIGRERRPRRGRTRFTRSWSSSNSSWSLRSTRPRTSRWRRKSGSRRRKIGFSNVRWKRNGENGKGLRISGGLMKKNGGGRMVLIGGGMRKRGVGGKRRSGGDSSLSRRGRRKRRRIGGTKNKNTRQGEYYSNSIFMYYGEFVDLPLRFSLNLFLLGGALG